MIKPHIPHGPKIRLYISTCSLGKTARDNIGGHDNLETYATKPLVNLLENMDTKEHESDSFVLKKEHLNSPGHCDLVCTKSVSFFDLRGK